MLRKALVARIERVEQTAQGQSILAPECICFPPHERPFFGFPIEEHIAAKVRCPLHGQRFKPLHHLFVPKWLRESERKRWPLRSEQYHRAWLASFPPAFWPAEEQEDASGRIFLKLKDGTRLLACEPNLPRSDGDEELACKLERC